MLVAAPILGSRRKNLDNQLRRSSYSISSRYLFAPFVADVHEVGDNAAEVAEDHAGSGEDLSNRVFSKISRENRNYIYDGPLMNHAGCTGHEEFSLDKLIANTESVVFKSDITATCSFTESGAETLA